MKMFLLRPLAAVVLLCCSATFVVADDKDTDEKKEETPKHKDYRNFTAKNGKSLEARVLTRIDDERYKVETPEGKVFTLNINSLSKSDARFLEFWEPDRILDLTTAELADVLEKMSYSLQPLTSSGDRFFVTATVDGKKAKFILDPSRKFSSLDPEAAKEIGMKLGQGGVTFTSNGKTERSQKGTAKVFTIGEVEVKSHSFEVLSSSFMFGSVPADTAGSIGTDLFKKLNALVDYDGKRLFVKGNE